MPAIFWQPARTDFRFLRGSCSNKVGEHGLREEKRKKKREDEKGGSFAASRLLRSISYCRGGRNPVDNGQKFPCLPPRGFLAFAENSTVLWGRINNAAWYRGIIARRREESLVVETPPFQSLHHEWDIRCVTCLGYRHEVCQGIVLLYNIERKLSCS